MQLGKPFFGRVAPRNPMYVVVEGSVHSIREAAVVTPGVIVYRTCNYLVRITSLHVSFQSMCARMPAQITFLSLHTIDKQQYDNIGPVQHCVSAASPRSQSVNVCDSRIAPIAQQNLEACQSTYDHRIELLTTHHQSHPVGV